MEDFHFFKEYEYEDIFSKRTNKLYLWGIFDGHFTEKCAQYCQEEFPKTFGSILSKNLDPKSALESTFALVEKNFLEYAQQINTEAGCTASTVMLVGNHLICFNLGDSEVILFRSGSAFPLTELHNFKNPKEIERVKLGGGIVFNNRKLGHPNWNPSVINISVTRAFGDLYFKLPQFTKNKPTGLIANPYSKETVLLNGDEFLIMASDGLWDVFNYEEVFQFVNPKLQSGTNLQEIAEQLKVEAASKGSKDNITLILISF